jgi:NhaA family Na+:H+ antiporter
MTVVFKSAFQRFSRKFVGGSAFLFGATALALIWANLSEPSYHHVWHADLTFRLGNVAVTKSLAHWIDEALMTLFFFVVGLEIKREVLVGELASFKKSLLPVAGAAGGMVVPAILYAVINAGHESAQGWGIPMATDIAFALAVLAILGKRIPLGLKVFLSALAIADDLGAVLVIALFYTQQIAWSYLAAAACFLLLLFIANRMWVRQTLIYAILGIGVWVTVLGSGVHATVAGVLVAMFIPARSKYETEIFLTRVRDHLEKFGCQPGTCGFTILLNRQHLDSVRAIEESCHDVETPLQRLEYSLHSWIAYLVIPLFALANAGLYLAGLQPSEAFGHPVTMGILVGLALGKPVGICLFTLLTAKWMRVDLPAGVTARHIIGAGCLGGIGFTMALFISGLSFTTPHLVEFSKLGIIVASLVSAIAGISVLFSAKVPQPDMDGNDIRPA